MEGLAFILAQLQGGPGIPVQLSVHQLQLDLPTPPRPQLHTKWLGVQQRCKAVVERVG